MNRAGGKTVVEVPTLLEYLQRLGEWGSVAVGIGGRWVYNPTTNEDCPLDDRGVAYLEECGPGRYRETWHVDGVVVEHGEAYHVCYIGHADRGWTKTVTKVGTPSFEACWRFCSQDEARWQSWRPYYREVLETGRDPMGRFETVLRRAAHQALEELDLPLTPGGDPPVPRA